jgi:hypothetical protein
VYSAAIGNQRGFDAYGYPTLQVGQKYIFSLGAAFGWGGATNGLPDKYGAYFTTVSGGALNWIAAPSNSMVNGDSFPLTREKCRQSL